MDFGHKFNALPSGSSISGSYYIGLSCPVQAYLKYSYKISW